MIDIPEMCKDGQNLRWVYWNGSPNAKLAYFKHLRTCDQCRAHFAALDKQAEAAEMPEVSS